jgi:hypothetical protein
LRHRPPTGFAEGTVVKKTPISALGLTALIAAGLATGPASAITFQPEPCVITLEPSYLRDADQAFIVPPSAVTCPPQFTPFNLTDLEPGINVDFVGQPGTATTGTAQLYVVNTPRYDPVLNGIVTTRELLLQGSPGTYTSVDTRDTSGMYLRDTTPDPDTYYRLVLARPFTITSGLPATPTCTLNMAPRYTYVWGQGQGNRYPISDSAISCTGGVTYNSGAYSVSANFDSRYRNQASLFEENQTVYNPVTMTYRQVNGLWLVPNTSANSQGEAERREMGLANPGGEGANSAFGRFTSAPYGLSVVSKADYTTRYALTLAAPFTIKRRTNVSATAKRTKTGTLAITISADRNASFSNKVAQTYRRQTVLPDTPADHAVLRRGSKVLKRVKLSPYGKGSVTVRDAKGRNAYSVTMVETNDNYQGVARFTR